MAQALLVQFDTMKTEFNDLQGKGLPAEVLEGLEMLKEMRGMKTTLGTHATKLASILTDMATHEDVSSVGNLVQDLDAKTQAELEKEAKRMVDAMCVHVPLCAWRLVPPGRARMVGLTECVLVVRWWLD